MSTALGARLLALAGQTRTELLLVAPYIKLGALARVLSAYPSHSPIKVVTRWRLEEIALGVSDLEIWPLLRDRGDQLWLHPNLHAKYYRGDATVLIGSANLTDTAMGWRADANLEILVEDRANELEHLRFEADLWAHATAVEDRLHSAFEAALKAFPPPVQQAPVALGFGERTAEFDAWRPQLRHPEDLWTAYSGNHEDLTLAAREAAAADLRVLNAPAGLSRDQFRHWIALQTRQHPEFRAIDDLSTQPRRFGEVRALLLQRGASDGGRAWQVWMRWILYFLAEDYEMKVANYSEIFQRRDRPL